ncbi:MAG: hypothetical protein ACYDCK_00360, partial [Thermoplasmatota archaeon]
MKFARLIAFAVVLLMTAPAQPFAAAQTPAPPPLPPVDPAKPIPPVAVGQDDQCVGSRFSEFIGGAPNALLRYEERNGTKVFLLCDPTLDARAKQFIDIVNQGLSSIDNYTLFLDNETVHRRGQLVPNQNLTYFSDDFQGKRIGGFGEWHVVNAVPDAAAPWIPYSTVEDFGTKHAGWRFGDVGDPYYQQGADAGIVTPAIDLSVNPLTDAVAAPRQYSDFVFGTLQSALGAVTPLIAPTVNTLPVQDTNGNQLVTAEGTQATLVSYLTTARAYSDVLVSEYEHQNTVKLSLKERWNLANGTDGVRVEVFVDHPPTSADLVSGGGEAIFPNAQNETPTPSSSSTQVPASCTATPSSGGGSAQVFFVPVPFSVFRCGIQIANAANSDPMLRTLLVTSCGTVPGVGEVNRLDRGCDASKPIGSQGAQSVASGTAFPGAPSQAQYSVTSEFRDANVGAFQQSDAASAPNAFGGNSTGASWETATFDLSHYVGHKIWLVFHAKSAFGANSADFFRDRTNFPVQHNWGFDLDYINVTGLAFPHHIRVVSLDEPATFLPSANDPTVRERTVPWPAVGLPINWTIQNAGLYDENVTATFTLHRTTPASDATFTNVTEFRLVSGVVRNLVYPWPENYTAREGELWNATLALSYTDAAFGVTPGSIDERNLTSNPQRYGTNLVGGPLASTGFAHVPGDTTLAQDIHARLVRDVRPQAKSAADSHAIVIDPAIAKRDESRKITATLANLGNTEETVEAQLLLHDATGLDVSQFIESNVTVPLGTLAPGETRDATWNVRPDAPGAFNATIVVRDVLAQGHPPLGSDYRTLFVGRTAGLVCFDDLASERDCTSSWNVTRPQEFQGRNTTASALLPDGSLWVGGDRGLLYRRSPDGSVWENFTLPTNETITALYGIYNAKVGAGSVFAAGTGGTVWHVDDTTKTNLSIPLDLIERATLNFEHAPTALTAAWAAANASELWAAGDGSIVYHYNATGWHAWNTSPINGTLWTHTNAIWGSGADDVYFSGRGGNVSHWNGVNFTDESVAFRKAITDAGACPTGCNDAVALAPLVNETGYTLYALLPDGWVVKQTTLGSFVLAAGLRGLDGSLVHRALTSASSRATTLAFSPRGEMMIGYSNGTIELCGGCTVSPGRVARTTFQVPIWTPVSSMSATTNGLAATTIDGAVLGYAKRVAVPNAGDWDPNAGVEPTGAAAWASNYILAKQPGAPFQVTSPGALRGEIEAPQVTPLGFQPTNPAGAVCATPASTPDAASPCVVTGPGLGSANKYDHFQLRVVHRFVHGAGQYLEPNNPASFVYEPGEIQLVFGRTNAHIGGAGGTPVTCPLQVGSYSAAQASSNNNPSGVFLHRENCAFLVQTLETLSTPTPGSGWTTDNLSFTGNLSEQTYPGFQLVGIQFFVPNAGNYNGGLNPTTADPHPAQAVADWAIASAELWGATGDHLETILRWNGTASATLGHWTAGDILPVDYARTVDQLGLAGGRVPQPAGGLVGNDITQDQSLLAGLGETVQPPSFVPVTHVFDKPDANLSTINVAGGPGKEGGSQFVQVSSPSLWHLANETEVPTWVANDKATQKIATDRHGNSTLATPAVDLRDASDPVLAIDHAFWLRAPTVNPSVNCTAIVDEGSVFVERLQPDGSWSVPYPIHPIGGFPTPASEGLPASQPSCAAVQHAKHVTDGLLDADYTDGFWGASVPLSPDLTASAILAASSYSTSRFALADQGLPFSPGGSIVRFLFVLADAGANTQNVLTGKAADPLYEGWYIRNFRVEAERVLGSDLAVASIAPEVGYDWKTIGFGNDTVVPINVTLTNDGRFDVFGSEVDLTVYAIDPRTNFAHILPCSPRDCADLVAKDDTVLAAGKNRYVTLYWHVPPTSGLQYFLVAKAKTLVDEDVSNNERSLGSIAQPLLAQSHPAVRVRVVATPQDASSAVVRTLDVIVDNVGNVPIGGLTVTRSIARTTSNLAPRLDAFQICPVGFSSATCGPRGLDAGTSASVATLGPGVGSNALLWVAACSPDDIAHGLTCGEGEGTYLVRAVLTDPLGRVPLTVGDELVGAFTTAFFDGSEGSPIGTAFHGTESGDLTAWTIHKGIGFQSDRSRVFGDPDFDAYPANANASFVTPTIDLSSVSNA